VAEVAVFLAFRPQTQHAERQRYFARVVHGVGSLASHYQYHVRLRALARSRIFTRLSVERTDMSKGFKSAETSSGDRRDAAPDELFETAVAHDLEGSRDEAERLYRAVLEAEPSHGGALHHLGAVCMQSGRREEAVELLRRARTAAPTSPIVHNDLGIALASTQKIEEARAAY